MAKEIRKDMEHHDTMTIERVITKNGSGVVIKNITITTINTESLLTEKEDLLTQINALKNRIKEIDDILSLENDERPTKKGNKNDISER
jgi:hypothetical protein